MASDIARRAIDIFADNDFEDDLRGTRRLTSRPRRSFWLESGRRAIESLNIGIRIGFEEILGQ